jgi:hypothetical protein
MTSGPESSRQFARDRVSLIGTVAYEPDVARIVAGLVAVLTYKPHAGMDAEVAERQAALTTDTAGSCRPLASAIDATTPSPQPASQITRAPLEDADRGHATNRDD